MNLSDVSPPALALEYLFWSVFSVLISIAFICVANKQVFDRPLDLLSLTINAMLDREALLKW